MVRAMPNRVACAFLSASFWAAASHADSDAAWKAEFERICIQTEQSSSLSQEELMQLIDESDQLLTRLQAVEDRHARIYALRLKNCREFFIFMLGVRDKDQNK